MYGSAKVVNITIGIVGMSRLRASCIDAIHDGHYEVYHNEVGMKLSGLCRFRRSHFPPHHTRPNPAAFQQ